MRVQRNDNPAGVRVSDLRDCTALLNKGSKTFSLATRLLPKDVATALTVLYAFCRVADDAVDDAPNVDAAKAALTTLQERVAHIYDVRVDVDHLVIDRALRAVVMHYDIPRAVLDGLLEGFLWDVEGRDYETIEEVHAYAARVAGTVGAMIAYVTRCPQLLARATDLGCAMQLTNIARDVGEDARRGRLYLPRQWMREHGLDPDAFIAAPQMSRGLAAVIESLLREADRLYRRADAGIEALPKSVRFAIRAARLLYAAIGDVVSRNGFNSVDQRAVTSKWTKLVGVVRSLWPLPHHVELRLAPPLGAVVALLPEAEVRALPERGATAPMHVSAA